MSKEEASSWRRGQHWKQNCNLLEEGNVSNMFLNLNRPVRGTEGPTSNATMSLMSPFCRGCILPCCGYIGPTNTSFDDNAICDAINIYLNDPDLNKTVPINCQDTSQVTNMSNLFAFAVDFNDLGAEVKEWKAKFAVVMEKLCTLEEASLSQNLPLLNDSVSELILSDHLFVCPRRDPSTYGSTWSMMIS
eukprot:11807192-Ditylum_brightwellii.AAC.1